jgi:hypothetical protein
MSIAMWLARVLRIQRGKMLTVPVRPFGIIKCKIYNFPFLFVPLSSFTATYILSIWAIHFPYVLSIFTTDF